MPRHHRWPPVLILCTALAGGLLPGPIHAQSVPGAAVLLVGKEATRPLPLLMAGNDDQMVMDLLFLRLARLEPALRVSGDSGFRPELARQWVRRDSVTLAFDLDPRARWHDGKPVTATDVVATLEAARNPETGGRAAALLTGIAGVQAEGPQTVVVRFTHPYAEQLYDATYHVPPLPTHLLPSLDQAALQESPLVRAPVGNGPYRWQRQVPGQFIELEAVPGHFLGKPGISRVIIRFVPDAESRLNLMLSGEADAAQGIVPPLANLDRIRARGGLEVVPVADNTIGYVLFNFRNPENLDQPHPILSDHRVREAIYRALDRERLVRAVYGPYAAVADGPTSQVLWIRTLAPTAPGPDLAEARRLLDAAGWRDSDGDGVRDRAGLPLELEFNVPAPSAPRRAIALQVQEQLRAVGVRLDVQISEGAVWMERRNTRRFDLDFGSARQDPSPRGLTNSWTCAMVGRANANVGSYCNPAVDSALAEAERAPDGGAAAWRRMLALMDADRPAIFLFAPATIFVRSDRYTRAPIRADSPWAELASWQVDPARALPRDRTGR